VFYPGIIHKKGQENLIPNLLYFNYF